MDFISKLPESVSTTSSIKLRLHQHLLRKEPARSLSTLHASEVTKPDFCARRNAILTTLGHQAAPEWMNLSLDFTFAIGRFVQDHIVSRAADAGMAIGDWRCVSCRKLHRFMKRPGACETCGCKRFDPVEVRFYSKVSGISGGFDMLINVGAPKLRLTEIKTMAPEEFKKLVAPLAEHRTRTNLYMRIVQESDHPHKDKIDTTKANILYVSKGGYGTMDETLKKYGINDKFSPLKEFVINHDLELTAPLSEKAKSFSDYRFGHAGMPGRISLCSDIMSKCAQNCEAKVACFGQMFPAGMMNPSPLEVVA